MLSAGTREGGGGGGGGAGGGGGGVLVLDGGGGGGAGSAHRDPLVRRSSYRDRLPECAPANMTAAAPDGD